MLDRLVAGLLYGAAAYLPSFGCPIRVTTLIKAEETLFDVCWGDDGDGWIEVDPYDRSIQLHAKDVEAAARLPKGD